MPAPVLPSTLCETVPTTNSDFCNKIKLVFLKFPSYVCQLFSYIFDSTGRVSDEFKTAASHMFPGAVVAAAISSPPMGWLQCNGQAVSRTTYAALFSAVGTTYGAGDNSTTFNLPNIVDRVIVGVSGSKSLGWTGGAETVALMQANMPAHVHTFNGREYDAGGNQTPNRTLVDDDYGGASSSVTTDSRGSNEPHENMQPSFALNWFIKT